jgi:hypothetical protein
MAMESSGHDRGSVRNFVRFLQRPENLLTESHCRADFLLRFRSYESGAGHGRRMPRSAPRPHPSPSRSCGRSLPSCRWAMPSAESSRRLACRSRPTVASSMRMRLPLKLQRRVCSDSACRPLISDGTSRCRSISARHRTAGEACAGCFDVVVPGRSRKIGRARYKLPSHATR